MLTISVCSDEDAACEASFSVEGVRFTLYGVDVSPTAVGAADYAAGWDGRRRVTVRTVADEPAVEVLAWRPDGVDTWKFAFAEGVADQYYYETVCSLGEMSSEQRASDGC